MHFASEPSPKGCKGGFVLGVSYLRPWSLICGSIAVSRFILRPGNPRDPRFKLSP